MPKPKDKPQLLAESLDEYQALESFLEKLDLQQRAEPGMLGEWSAKDVLAHLYEWQQMFFGWYETGLRGDTPVTPAEGFKWNQLPALNRKIYDKYHEIPFDQAMELLRESHQKMMALIVSLSHEQIFSPGYFPWTKASSLMSYIRPNTGNHYRWARTGMRKGLKKKQQGA